MTKSTDDSKSNNLPKTSRSVNNTKGSVLWEFNHMRRAILTNLLNDLVDLEYEGFSNQELSDKVQLFLEYLINAATEVPEGGLFSGKPLYKDFESFKKAFVEWNNIKGHEDANRAARRKRIEILRNKRQNITNKVRKLQYELENNLDQKLIHDSYKVIGDMINLVPDIFKNLSGAYRDYLKGRDKKQ